ncbi:hypothetical protein NC651_011643 [Populus alba x Populus x berolinensis]|nr:hypothetical protein NC651_011643 [Populus alba x Populus x berolinensis]
MLGWEQWLWSDGVNESTLGKFPKLSELTLINCPRLIGDLPSCLPSLKKLHIEKCQGVVLALRAAPDLTSLASLQLIKISGLVSLQEELVQALVALEDLDLECCNELAYLWQDGVDLDKLSSLKHLRIVRCEQLVSLVEGEEGILPCNLEVLRVQDCSNLGKLANGLCSLTSLRDLTISGCRKLECFSEGAGLPLSLKRLEISSCDSLRSLPDGMMTMVNDSDCNQCLLEELSVTACPSLKWLPKGKLPKTLKFLDISWDNQESLPEGILQRDARETSRFNLEHLTLRRLSATSLQTGEFPISLKKLDIFYCRIPLSDPSQYPSSVDAEWNIIYDKLDRCVQGGAKVVLSRLAIGDLATPYFADRDIFCAGRVSEEDLQRVSAASGGTVQTTVNNIIDEFIEEAERSLHDAIMIVRRAMKNSSVVAGGGAIDYLRLSSKEYRSTVFKGLTDRFAARCKTVDLELLTCRKITSLSSVGKLPALRHLSIKGMDGVKVVYAEDFQSLETLYIEDMLGWERWLWSDGVNESTLGKFPKLSELTLINCPRLIGDLPSFLPSLKELRIERCQGVVLALRAAPDLTSLASLRLEEIYGLVSLQEELVQALVALEDLDLSRCNELTYLWQDGVDLDKLSSLKRLWIYQCEQLVSLVEGEEGILPCNLEVLTVKDCSNLGKLANGLSSLTSLRDLTISRCRKLECFSEGAGLPLSLKSLKISSCDSLRSLPDGMMTLVNDSDCNQCLLEALSVTACPSLKWLPKGKLPKTLKSLSISWDNQESLPEGILQRDARETSRSNLEHLRLQSLSATSFPTGVFPISLKKLTIVNCRIPMEPMQVATPT